MGTFSDDFERADGALGANWATTNANTVISSGKVGAPTATYCRPASVTQASAADASITIASAPGAATYVQVVVKANDNFTQGYRFYATVVGGNIVCYLSTIGGTNGDIAVSTAAGSMSWPCTFRLAYSNGSLFGYVNGTLMVVGFHAGYSANSRVGFYEYNAVYLVDYFTTTSPDATTFAVSPTAVRRNGQPVYLTLTGSGTAWTAGTPGSPTFTASDGTLSGQTVAGPTVAYVWFAPPDATENVTITDPSTNLTATIAVSPTVPEGGGVYALKLTDAGAAILNNAGADYPTDQVPTNNTIIIPAAENLDEVKYLNSIADMWNAHFRPWAVPPPLAEGASSIEQIMMWVAGGYIPTMATPPPPAQTTLKQDTEALGLQLVDVTDVLIPGAITAIQGADGPNLEQLEAELGVQGQAQYSSVINAIDQLYGTSRPSLTDIAGLIQQLSTIAGYTLGDVLDAIAAIGPGGSVDLEPVLHKLQHIQPDEYVSLTTLHSQQVLIVAAITALAVAFAKFVGPTELTAANIIDTVLNGDQAIIDEIRKIKAPPHWPGHANVSFGVPHDLATTVQVDGPMHGVLIDITATEPGTSYMQYDGVKSWRHIGGLAFYTDDGQMETYQALNFASAVYVPKTMSVAQGVKLYKSHLPRGSITPWTIAE